MNQNWRAVAVIGLLGAANLIVFALEYVSIIRRPGSGPEGIERAIVANACVIFSILVSGIGAKQTFDDFRKGKAWAWLAFATLVASCPALIFVSYGLVPSWLRHHGH